MPEPKQLPPQLEDLKKYLSQELLGEIPLFYEQVIIKDLKVKDPNVPIAYQREIEVSAFQTKAFMSKAYHKFISRII